MIKQKLQKLKDTVANHQFEAGLLTAAGLSAIVTLYFRSQSEKTEYTDFYDKGIDDGKYIVVEQVGDSFFDLCGNEYVTPPFE